jgi:hypothetical protein
MRSFIAAHAFWLWSLLHTVKHPYSAATLGLFVFVGALQILVAVGGGALAVEALSTEAARKNRLTVGFWLLGVMLFVATAWTGLLNDESQRASDGRADNLKGQLTELSNSVLTTMRLAELKTLSASAPDTAAQEKLSSQLRQAIAQTNELARRYSTVPTQPPTTVPAPQGPPQSNIPALPLRHDDVPTPASLEANVQATIQNLASIDRTADSMVQSALGGVRGVYIAGGSQASKDAAFRNTIPQLQEIIRSRNDAFQRLLPGINRERTEAIRVLKPSPSDVEADKTAFDNAVSKSNEPITLPNSWQNAGFLYMLRYNEMNAYLSSLQQRLKAAQ